MIGYMVAMAVLVVASTVYSLVMMGNGQQMNQDDMSPANLDAFNITTTDEGKVIPLVYGRVRLPGNLLYFGNLKSTPEYDEVEGGKGGGGDSQSILKGYHYNLDMWQGICRGPAQIVRVYEQDNPKDWDKFSMDNDVTLNDGTGIFYPADAGEFASCLPGICHVWLKQFYVGFNTTNAPTLHFVVEDTCTCPVNHADMPTGKNPAAVIYLLLMEAGVNPADIDMQSFNDAADFWFGQGYGLNVAFTRQETLEESIKKILGWVGGYLIEDAQGKFRLKAHDPAAPSVATITDETCLSCTFQRQTWDDTANVFVAKFMSDDLDNTTRTVLARNTASTAMLGRELTRSVDLTCFRDEASASKRIWELMKRESFPSATLSVTVPLEFAMLEIGDIVTVSLDEYGVENLDCAVSTKELSSLDKGEVSLNLVQVPERVFDDIYTLPGQGAQWQRPDYAPVKLNHARLFELPRTPFNGKTPALLVLAAREVLREDGLAVYHSTTGTDYKAVKLVTAWSQYGTLQAAYPDDTYDIDDDIGIVYRPYREDPVFHPLSRTDLFNTDRFLIAGDEIMRFQHVTLRDDGTIRLTGIVRGVFNTPVQHHASGGGIWLTPVGDAALYGAYCRKGYYKLQPNLGRKALDLTTVSAMQVGSVDKAAFPWPVARIEAVRSGADISIRWWPQDTGHGGAGLLPEDESLDQWPPTFDGDFMVNGEVVAGCELAITNDDALNITISARQQGHVSGSLTLHVPEADGTYTA